MLVRGESNPYDFLTTLLDAIVADVETKKGAGASIRVCGLVMDDDIAFIVT